MATILEFFLQVNIFLLKGMHHSREPVSFLMNLNILFKILYDYTRNNNSVIELINTRSLYFIPVVNVDGFIENANRFDVKNKFANIRKNRRSSPIFDQCKPSEKGVDLNRNYDYKFAYDEVGNLINLSRIK